tara:strand:- start:124 stop:447 length:324 start_codon:yes stop_codon:yes gene_type:complete
MAQNFRRYTGNDIGTGATTIATANSYDTYVGIHVTNIHTSAVLVDVFINDGTNDIYLVKAAPLPVGGALQVLGSGKIVVQSGDVLKVQSDTASSVDCWVSAVDDIST